MNQVELLISQFLEEARNPKQTVTNVMASTGKKAFGCFPIYVPEEIIYAAGVLPVGMWGGADTGVKSECLYPKFLLFHHARKYGTGNGWYIRFP